MASSSFLSPTINDTNQQLPSLATYTAGLPYNTTPDPFANPSVLTNTVTYSSASELSASTPTTAATDTTGTTTNQANGDGTYTVAGWTWNPSNAVTDGSVILGDSNISTFGSGFLNNEGQPLAKQTVGSLLFGQSNASLTLGNSRIRSEIELTWGGPGLPNEVGNDFVVYENGNLNAPEGYAVAVRLAGSDTFSAFRYEFYDTYDGVNGLVLATAFDLSDFGITDGQSIDAIRIINLQSDDLVDGAGQGFLSTSGSSPLNPFTGQPFGVGRIDPDITFVAGLHDLQEVEPSVFKIVGTGDFNGDGQTDILFRNRGTGENLVWLMNGTQLESTVSLLSVQDPNWDIKQTGDFNSDGQVDLVWRNEATGENVIWLMNGTELVEGIGITPVDDLNWDIRGTGDFNGDGQTDLIWRDRTEGDNAIWLLNGTDFFQGVYSNPVNDPSFYIGGTGDFNGDGKVDLVWRNQDTGENALVLMGGIYPAQETLFIDPWDDLDWEIRSTGDLNGDGQTDILWQNTLTNDLVVWLMNGTELEDVSSIG